MFEDELRDLVQVFEQISGLYEEQIQILSEVLPWSHHNEEIQNLLVVFSGWGQSIRGLHPPGTMPSAGNAITFEEEINEIFKEILNVIRAQLLSLRGAFALIAPGTNDISVDPDIAGRIRSYLNVLNEANNVLIEYWNKSKRL